MEEHRDHDAEARRWMRGTQERRTDGWGVAPEPNMKRDAIVTGDMTNMDTILEEHSVRTLHAHGIAMGLGDGLMGDSEVGHLEIGAGRVVWQDIVRIDVSINKRQCHKNEVIVGSCKHAKEGNPRLHLLGLVSDGYVKGLLAFTGKEKYGQIVTVMGHYYAMNRDRRCERIKIALDGLVKDYEKDKTDEFLKCIIVNGDEGCIKDGETLFFNYRSDRMRQIATVLGFRVKSMKVDVVTAYIAEPEKYAHVTFFFNGGVVKQHLNEERHKILSLRDATYDKDPKMSIQAVANKVMEVIRKSDKEFVMHNFAPPDMAGHTGVPEAAVEATSATNKAAVTVYPACEEAGYILLITADHGNAEQMIDLETGAPHTAHMTNPVPFIMKGDQKEFYFTTDKKDSEEKNGALCDVTPTVLDIVVAEMTGHSLLMHDEEKKEEDLLGLHAGRMA
ncbi:uncharacterized protein LAESUDRAFT_757526 [Laetiporus sulphureus 93-53]|uniref:phosphoglycerate mutase (2,3-diphosphoglycerate-independent) n=1 Tax=Laetiporus sulphureus 93-53 TaxID=1314785 RepID=A0A165FE01_9APHY|nr:uncharacterized protein LAESUDRAFT_757526 [Laetiporus sulphureus 93-53]KZT08827.1 hypothetical protein LAESUDRAFT_757526 [Laetiporus sulphureus 93-53]